MLVEGRLDGRIGRTGHGHGAVLGGSVASLAGREFGHSAYRIGGMTGVVGCVVNEGC